MFLEHWIRCVSVSKENQKRRGKRKLSIGMFIKLKKTKLNMYTAPIESDISLCFCACSVQFFVVILLFLPFSWIRHTCQNSLITASVPWNHKLRMHIGTISVPSCGILPQTSKYGKGLLVIKGKPGSLSQSRKGDEIMKNKFKYDLL